MERLPLGMLTSRDSPLPSQFGSKQRSVLLQPATSFPLPVSYAVMPQPIFTSNGKNINVGNVSSKSHASSLFSEYPNEASSPSNLMVPTPGSVDSASSVTIPMRRVSQALIYPANDIANNVSSIVTNSLTNVMTNNITSQSMSNLVDVNVASNVTDAAVDVTRSDLVTPVSLIQRDSGQTTIEVPLVTDPLQQNQNGDLAMPLINQFFQTPDTPHSSGLVVSDVTNMTTRDSVAIDRTIDRTTKELLSIVMGMTQDGSAKDVTSTVITDTGFDSIIDQSENSSSQNEVVTMSQENPMMSPPVGSLNLETAVVPDVGEEHTVSGMY